MKLFDKKILIETTIQRAMEGYELTCVMPDGRILEFDTESGERTIYKSEDEYLDKTGCVPEEDFDTLEIAGFEQSLIDVIKNHFVKGTKFYTLAL